MAGTNFLNSVQVSKPRSNVFDLSHDVKLSMNMGNLVPIAILECVPGDKFNLSCESMIRFAPMVAPVMHRFDVTMHYFFVPNRIIWPNWEDFITNTPDAMGNLPAFPTLNFDAGTWNFSTLPDYMGIPMPVGYPVFGPSETVSALPFAAYQKIYNEYYRDQNLVTEVVDTLIDGDNSGVADFYLLRKRAWEHDYFTAALPFAQKGASVNLPLAGFNDVPVRVNINQPGSAVGTLTGTGTVSVTGDIPQPVGSVANVDGLFAETSQLAATSTTINDLRRAFRLQEWLEKAARGGSRYVEMIRSMFGVISSDKRQQRPEYITGVKSPVMVSEVLNTTGTTDAPQGDMAGHGIAVVNGKYGHYFCEEHGYIIGIMSVMPKTAYQQGLAKHFLKTSDPFEFYWEQFSHIGEQAVLKKEVYAFQGGTGANTFGYVPRYSEYKFEPNRVAGQFRSSLNHWHAGRIFSAAPALNQAFVECDATHRIFADTDPDDDKLWVHVYNKIRAVRPMPKFGTPTF